VCEWVLDYWWPVPKTAAYAGKDPAGPETAENPKAPRRVMRGGTHWNFSFGAPDGGRLWSRQLGNLCDPGNGHAAVGFRVAVAAALAKTPQPGPGREALSPAAIAARRELIAGVPFYRSRGLPGPVYCLGKDAFPLIAARNWDGSSACVAAAAFCGKGRVVVVADEGWQPMSDDNGRFFENVRRWLSNGKKSAFGQGKTVRQVDLSELATRAPAPFAKDLAECRRFVEQGGGLLVFGRAWPWRQQIALKTGKACIADWEGNRMLEPFGLMIGDFCVGQTSSEGFATRRLCGEGCAVPPAEVYQTQTSPRSQKPVTIPPKARGPNGILVASGETIAFLGDSITRLGANPLGYQNLVLKGLEIAGVTDVGRVPAGIDGQHSGDMLGRVGGIFANPDVKILTLMCGVNDVWGYDWGRGLELEAYERNVRAIYDTAAAAGVQVIAMTPTLIQEDPDREMNRILDPYADFVRAEAKVRGLPLADCRAAQIAALKKLPKDGTRHFTYDGVHPVWEGNVLIATQVLKALGVRDELFPEIEKAWNAMKASQK
jgi:lysophospholipase L1-like esterase